MELVLYGRPITKKNSSRIITKPYPRLIPSKQFVSYEKDCLRQISGKYRQNISDKCNLKCIYYMPTRHRVDLVNLLEATCDILVKANVIEDDNCKIIATHDGSFVTYDKNNPRVEITLERI